MAIDDPWTTLGRLREMSQRTLERKSGVRDRLEKFTQSLLTDPREGQEQLDHDLEQLSHEMEQLKYELELVYEEETQLEQACEEARLQLDQDDQDLAREEARLRHGLEQALEEAGLNPNPATANGESVESPPLRKPSAVRLGDGLAYLRERRVVGVVSGLRIEATPDTGADESFISARFLQRMLKRQAPGGLSPIVKMKSSNPSPVQLASGKKVACSETVLIPWTFEGEFGMHPLSCRVLQDCSQDLILGDAFLRATGTLTKFKHRILTTLRSVSKRLFRLNYLSTETHRRRLWGYLKDDLIGALPDSGSDIMAISASYAKRRGLRIDHRPDEQVLVEFADGSRAETSGIVRDLEWQFATTEARVACDFYVLEDLPVDVLLSSDFVFDHDVHGQHRAALSHHGELRDVLNLCNIRLLGRYSKALSRLEDEGLDDITSPDAFSRPMIQRELARRDDIRDAIEALPDDKKSAAEQDEAERQSRWEQPRAEHAQRWANSSASGTPTASTSGVEDSQQAGDPGDGRNKTLLQVGRWARRKWKVASIPPMPLRRPAPAVGSDDVV